MKTMNAIKRYGAQLTAAGGLMALPVMVMAEVPETVKTAIDGAKADGLSVGWIVVGVVAALFVISIVKRMIK